MRRELKVPHPFNEATNTRRDVNLMRRELKVCSSSHLSRFSHFSNLMRRELKEAKWIFKGHAEKAYESHEERIERLSWPPVSGVKPS